MASHPALKINPGQPLQHCGMECTPFVPKAIVGWNKKMCRGYVAVSVCFVTREIHHSFMVVCCLIGRPSDIYSNCSVNFVGAGWELRDFMKFVTAEIMGGATQRYLCDEGIRVVFQPCSTTLWWLWEGWIYCLRWRLGWVVGMTNFYYYYVIHLITLLMSLKMMWQEDLWNFFVLQQIHLSSLVINFSILC